MMNFVNISGSVWSKDGVSLFFLIVVNRKTGQGFYLESGENEELSRVISSDTGTLTLNDLTLNDRLNSRVNVASHRGWQLDGKFDESFPISDSKSQMAGLVRLCQFFEDYAQPRLSLIWNEVVNGGKSPKITAVQQGYQIQTNNSSVGSW